MLEFNENEAGNRLIELIFVPLLLGLFSATHCLGMCSGIVGMLTLGLPREIRDTPARRRSFLLLYNLARIFSYTLAGAVTAQLGGGTLAWIAPQLGHTLLQGLAAGVLLIAGLTIAGWFPHPGRLERLGSPLWRRLEPLGRRLLPVDRPAKAFGFGLVWGWLPCGMVYTAVIYATTSTQAWQGAVFMFFFGLGTLPATLSAGLVSNALVRLSRNPTLRQGVGLAFIALALTTLLYPTLVKEMPWPLDYIVELLS